jgi:pseudouridine synthase
MDKLKQKSSETEGDVDQLVRLHKFLARCGVGSRRQCEELIRQGLVHVNGVCVTQLGTRINPIRDKISVGGKPICLPTESHVYYILNKPRGVVTTCKDERGRTTVLNLLEGITERVFPVGRLDKESEGLLLLTNDGELAHRLMHPSFRIEKEYFVEVEGCVQDADIAKLEQGISFEGEYYKPARVRVLSRGKDRSMLSVTIAEGRKRQVRRMCLAVGHPVRRLIRLREGCLELGHLPPGKYRSLTPEEVQGLRREVGLD